ncbi:phenylalanyl-tRNA synthetase [Cutibacterium acnes JCM 18918]|nr:phenylalanyl-tRNA synthetase [Cutibacterium acnes JCM 18918]
MKVPMSWLQAMVNLPDGTTTDKVAKALTNHTATVEKVEVVGGELTGPIVIGHILSSVPEPQKNGKVINWCRVDVGPRYNAEGHPKNIEEGVEGRGIICGAPNAVEGAWVVVSLPGAVLPGGFAISARKTYGHMSDGMLCAPTSWVSVSTTRHHHPATIGGGSPARSRRGRLADSRGPRRGPGC